VNLFVVPLYTIAKEAGIPAFAVFIAVASNVAACDKLVAVDKLIAVVLYTTSLIVIVILPAVMPCKVNNSELGVVTLEDKTYGAMSLLIHLPK
jgi:hypothetical protein